MPRGGRLHCTPPHCLNLISTFDIFFLADLKIEMSEPEKAPRDMTEPATERPKRKPGRPKGLPRTGGRRRGTPNKKNQVTRDYVIREGAPLAFLCSVVRGKRFTAAAEPGGKKRTHVFPSLDQRLRAAEVLSRKVLPDLKTTELTGKDGGPVALTLLDFLRGLPD